MEKGKGRKWFIFFCAAPAVTLFTIFMVLPTLNVFRMSLFRRSAYSPNEEFVGLENFTKLFSDANFIRSMQNTILLIVAVTIVTFAFALVFAGILSREKIRGQNFFRVIFYIPNILSVVVIAAIFSAIYDTNNGMLNSFLSLFSPDKVAVMWKGENLVMTSLIIAMVWQAIGYYMVMYMASMASVPGSLYESASLDGAGYGRTMVSVIFPMAQPSIITIILFNFLSFWNEYIISLTLLSAQNGPRTLPVGLLNLMQAQQSAAQYGIMYAGLVLVMLPTLVLYICVQKKLTQGMTVGGLKG